MTPRPFKLGARSSPMALWQARLVASLLQRHGAAIEIVHIDTTGDRLLDRPIEDLPGDGPFTDDIEAALHAGRIDLAVHCMKDLPVDSALGPSIAAVLRRSSARESLVSRNHVRLARLPPGALIGTSSPRRSAQLLALRPDLRVGSIRGPVNDRVRRIRDGCYDGAILARAGLERLNLIGEISEEFPLKTFLPAPAQGALVVQTRPDDRPTRELCQALDHPNTRLAVTAELALFRLFEHDREITLAAYAVACANPCGGRLILRARALARDASWQRDIKITGHDPFTVARQAADQLGLTPASRQGPQTVTA